MLRVREQVTERSGIDKRGPLADASVTVMDITIHAILPHSDPDASLAFCRDRPEVVAAVLLLVQAGPG
jgi:hypothetical protein